MKVISNNYKWAFALTPRTVTTHLILHYAGASKATAYGIHAYHLSKGWAVIAYHYFVSKSVEVYCGRPENMRSGHTTNWNYCSMVYVLKESLKRSKCPKHRLQQAKSLLPTSLDVTPQLLSEDIRTSVRQPARERILRLMKNS